MGFAASFAPVFVQVALTFTLLFLAGRARLAAIQRGDVDLRDIALREPNWPAQPTQLINAYHNQLELPVLFYLFVMVAFFSAHMTFTLGLLSWLFVATRLLHALVHGTTNELRRRFVLFASGVAILAFMWLLLAIDVFVIGA